MGHSGKKLASILIGFLIVMLSASLSLAGLFDSWQNKLTNKFFQPAQTSDDIVILAMDDESVNAKSRGIDMMNRANVARALQNVILLKPKVLALDYMYLSASSGLTDAQLTDLGKEIIANDLGKNEILNKLIEFKKEIHPTDEKLSETLANADNLVMAVLATNVHSIQNGVMAKENLKSSIDIFSKNATAGGNVVMEIDPADSLVRKYFTTLSADDGSMVKSFSVAAARLYGSPYVDQIPLIDENNRMYINYFGLPGAYKRISAIDAYDGKIKREDVEGKIILFGPTSSVFNDLEHTPIAPKQQMPGVEIHANALQTILDGKFLIDAPTAAKAAIIALMTAAAVAVFMYSSIRVSLAVFLLLWVAYYFGNKLAFNRGVILDQIFPYLALILSLISVYIYRFFTESKEKDFVRGAFGAYVSPEVLKQITDDPSKLKLGGEEKIVTVFFSDIKDSTKIGESLSAHSLVELLNEYFSEMSEIVIKNGGTVDKFEGDAIMAVFGAPLDDPNHAALACRAAVESQLRLAELRVKWAKEGKPELFSRIGINSGPVVAGNVGSKDRFDYTVMGDTVNLGSRLEQANKEYGTEIMVGKNTYDLVQGSPFKDMFSFRFLDKLTVKGKTEAVEVYELKRQNTA